jgi:ATP-dependent RNA helicase DDX41
MMALEEEMKLSFIRGEGPVGIILCPSRELANQTYENLQVWCSALSKDPRYPRLNIVLCIGGISMSEQSHVLSKGLHIVIATPGRLIDMLEKKRFTFNNCKFLCMDEADRMIDLGFEDDVRNIMSFFKVGYKTHYPSISLSLPPASKADIVILGYHAQKDSRLCTRITH